MKHKMRRGNFNDYGLLNNKLTEEKKGWRTAVFESNGLEGFRLMRFLEITCDS